MDSLLEITRILLIILFNLYAMNLHKSVFAMDKTLMHTMKKKTLLLKMQCHVHLLKNGEARDT